MSDAYLATACNIPLKFIRAIRAVESNGNAAAIRFEPHIFHRDRPLRDGEKPFKKPASAARILAHADPIELAKVPYTPGDDGKARSRKRAETNVDAFHRAYEISPTRAIRATSWGAFQVLGWALLENASSPENAVASFFDQPDVVSDRLLVRWCKRNPKAIDAAQRGDVSGWVCYYNGARGPKAQGYIDKMNRELNGAQG